MADRSAKFEKHEIWLWIFMSMLIGFLAYITPSQIRVSKEYFPKIEGTVLSAQTLKKSSEVYLRGIPIKVRNTHFRIILDTSPMDFTIFRTDRDYSGYDANIKPGDFVKIYYQTKSDKSLLEVVQIESGSGLLYSKEEWNQQEWINFFLLLFSSLFFLSVGIYRHRRLMKKRLKR